MACNNVCLLTDLNPTGDAGGTWAQISGPDISGLLIGDDPCIDFDAQVVGTYVLEYSGGTGTCASATQITINNLDTGDPGTTQTVTLCPADAPINLFTTIGATDGAEITWAWSGSGIASCAYDDNATAADATDDTFDPSDVCLSVPVTLVFILTGTPVSGATQLACCVNSSATLTVDVVASFDSGTTDSFDAC